MAVKHADQSAERDRENRSSVDGLVAQLAG